MQLPMKAHYATLAMLVLADRHVSREVLPARQIAEEQSIPLQFLTQILQQLRSAGLVSSTRGANGGFFLQRSPERITLSEVIDAVCPANPQSPVDSTASMMSDVVHEVWQELQAQQRATLARLTLAELLARCRDASRVMFYI